MSQHLTAGSRALNSQNSRSYDVLSTRPPRCSADEVTDGGGGGAGGDGGGDAEGGGGSRAHVSDFNAFPKPLRQAHASLGFGGGGHEHIHHGLLDLDTPSRPPRPLLAHVL